MKRLAPDNLAGCVYIVYTCDFTSFVDRFYAFGPDKLSLMPSVLIAECVERIDSDTLPPIVVKSEIVLL